MIAALFAFILPVMGFANSWTLTDPATIDVAYSVSWSGTVSYNNCVVMLEAQAPGATTWQAFGSSFPDSNRQVSISGNRPFNVLGSWQVRVVQYPGSGAAVASTRSFNVNPAVIDTIDPTTPSNVTVSNLTYNSCNVTWTAATDNVGVTGYLVFLNSTQVASATSTATTLALSPSTSYTVSAVAMDAAGNTSEPSILVPFTTPTQPVVTLGWTAPSSVTTGSYAQVTWVGNASASTVLMWCLPPSGGAWSTCGGGGGTTNPKTVNGGWTPNQVGSWTFQVRDGPYATSSVLSSFTIVVR